MTSYTKYHKKYSQDHKNKINRHRMRKYYYTTYGIPMDRGDLMSAFCDQRSHYVKLKKLTTIIQSLNPEIVNLIINHSNPSAGAPGDEQVHQPPLVGFQ